MRRVALIPLVSCVLILATAAPAWAHAVLLGTKPVNGAVFSVSSAPRSVSMHFGENVGVKLGAVRVYDDRGQLIDSGKPEHPGGDGSTVQASLPRLGGGTYVVTWRVISADTHPVEGAFTFRVGAARRDVSSLTTRLLSSQAGSKTVGVLYGAVRFLEFSLLLLLIGGVSFLVLVWPGGRKQTRARRIIWTAWWALLVVTAIGFAIEGIYAAAFPLRDLVRPEVLSDTWHSRYGEMAALRALLLVGALPLIRALLGSHERPEPERTLPRWWHLVGAALALGLCLTVSLTGHAVTGRWRQLALPADVMHLLAASLWFGGLAMLIAVALPRASASALDRLVPRYSTLATASVIAIVVTGVFQSIRQVGTLHALTSTDYGQILLVKVGAFVVVIVFAVLSRDVVRIWYRAPDDARAEIAGTATEDSTTGPVLGEPTRDGTPVAVLDRPDPQAQPENTPERWARRRLLRTATLEVIVLVVVLVATSLLVDARPAYETSTGPVNITMKTPKVWFDVNIDPGRAGANTIHLYAVNPTGGVSDPLQISMQIANKDHGVAPIKVPLIRAAPGHDLTQGFQIPFAGTWQVTVRALVTQLDEAAASQDIPIH